MSANRRDLTTFMNNMIEFSFDTIEAHPQGYMWHFKRRFYDNNQKMFYVIFVNQERGLTRSFLFHFESGYYTLFDWEHYYKPTTDDFIECGYDFLSQIRSGAYDDLESGMIVEPATV